eukprot:gene15010-30276_t
MDVTAVRHSTPGIRHGGGRIHLAAAASSLPPTAVSAAVSTQIEAEVLLGGHCADAAAMHAREDAYPALAALLRCKPEEVALVSGAAEGWRAVLLGLELNQGDRILLSAAEADAARIACVAACGDTGAVVELLPTYQDGTPDLKALEDTIDYNVKLVALSHVAPGHGVAVPAAAVGAVARKHGVPFLLDVTQTVGQLVLDVEALHADIVTASSSSYLRGPRGTGFLYIKSSRMARLVARAADGATATLLPAGLGGGMSIVHSASARRFEMQHDGIAAEVGLGVAARYAEAIDVTAAAACIATLAAHDIDTNTSCYKSTAASASNLAAPGGAVQTGIVPFLCAGVEPAEVVRQLATKNIVISMCEMRPLEHACAGQSAAGSTATEEVLQIAVHYYNTAEEVAEVCSQIAEIIDEEDPSLDEWEEVDCPLSPMAPHHPPPATSSSAAACTTTSPNPAFNVANAAFDHRQQHYNVGDDNGAATPPSMTADPELEDDDDERGERGERSDGGGGDDGDGAMAMDGMGGLGASIVHDDRSWGSSTTSRPDNPTHHHHHHHRLGNGIGLGLKLGVGGEMAATRTVLFPLLAGIPRRGLLGTAPLLFDGSPPSTSMWDAPMQHRLFQQPAYDASNPFDARSENADAGDGSSSSSSPSSSSPGARHDDNFESVVVDDGRPMEMFLNGICCNDEELENSSPIPSAPTNVSLPSAAPIVVGLNEATPHTVLSVPLSSTPPTVGFGGEGDGSDTASSLDSGLDLNGANSTDGAACLRSPHLPEGHTLLHCARGGGGGGGGAGGMPYPV